MRGRRTVAGAVLGVVLGIAGSTPTARADDAVDCLADYENAQLLRMKGQYRAARDAARACSRAQCRPALRTDCVDWLSELDRSVPSVVFEAHSERGDEVDVRVSAGDRVLTERLDGAPIEVDAGQQLFRFEIAGRPPIERSVVIKVGEKLRVVSVSFGEAPPAAPAPPAGADPKPAPEPTPAVPMSRPIPTSVYVSGGIAVAGVAGFALFAASAQSEKSTLDGQCAPFCTHAEANRVTTRYVLADMCLGVGVVAIGASTYLFFTRPSVPASPASKVAILPTPTGAFVSYSGAF